MSNSVRTDTGMPSWWAGDWRDWGPGVWAAGPYGFTRLAHRRRFAQYYRCFQAWLAQFGTPSFELETVDIDGLPASVVESVVRQAPFCALRSFRVEGRRQAPLRILLCAPLAGHHAVLLRDTVRAMLPDADVYVTDWADARDVPLDRGRFGLDDYVRTVQEFMHWLGPADLHVVAVCQATVPVLGAVALMAAAEELEPRSLTLIGGPIDARLSPTSLERVAASVSAPWLDANAIDVVPEGYPGAGRRVYPGFLQYPTLVAAQPDRQLALVTDWLCRGASAPARAREIERAFAQYSAVLDMTAEFFLDTLRVVFQRMLLPRCEWRVGGRRVVPEALARTRLMTVEAERDDIAGTGQTHAAHALCRGLRRDARRQFTLAGGDHYDLFSGRRWAEVLYPVLRDWMREA